MQLLKDLVPEDHERMQIEGTGRSVVRQFQGIALHSLVKKFIQGCDGGTELEAVKGLGFHGCFIHEQEAGQALQQEYFQR